MAGFEIDISPEVERFGFSANLTGGHMARSMMLDELGQLIASVPTAAAVEDYGQAILEDNALGKPTYSSRRKTFRHLLQLYGLDRHAPLFAALRKLADEDAGSLPLLAVVCSYCRDPQLRHSFTLIDQVAVGEKVSRTAMEAHLEAGFPGRFGKKMKKSLAQNVNTTWTAAGHLQGRSTKTRSIPTPRPAATVYAIFAGYLLGLRGATLLQSVFGRLVCSDATLIAQHLAIASSRGWLKFRHAGGITETDFSSFMTWIDCEQDVAHVTH